MVEELVDDVRAYKPSLVYRHAPYEHTLTGRQPSHLYVLRVPSERSDVCADPEQRRPDVLKPKVAIDLGCVAREEAEDGEPVADVDPHLAACGRDVLRLPAQAVRRTELEEAVR